MNSSEPTPIFTIFNAIFTLCYYFDILYYYEGPFEKLGAKEDESFLIGISQDNLEKSTWHYYNNYEISFITEGSERRIVADSIVEFQPGDLVFIVRNIPHVWIAYNDSRTPWNRFLGMVFL